MKKPAHNVRACYTQVNGRCREQNGKTELQVCQHIYHSIYEAAGQEKLKYVIENPDKLLWVYNELYTDSMIVPRIPDDVVIIWKENF